MKPRLISILKYLFFLSLAAFLLFWTFRGQDIKHLLDSLKNANYFWIAASILACLLAHIIRAIRWSMLIKPLGYQVSAKNSFYAVMIGYLANLAFPRMGEVSRCGVLTKTDEVPVAPLIGTVLTERIVDLCCLISVTFLAILIEFERISGFIYQNGWLKIQAMLSGAAIGWGMGVFIVLMLSIYLLKSQIKTLIKPFSNALQGLKSGLLSFKHMPNKAQFLLLSGFIWFFYLLSTYLCFFALSATAGLGVAAALAALVFGSLGMIVPVQGGIGAFHWMVAGGLTLYSIPKTEGLTFATLIHSSQILVILLIGGLSLIPVLFGKKKLQ